MARCCLVMRITSIMSRGAPASPDTQTGYSFRLNAVYQSLFPHPCASFLLPFHPLTHPERARSISPQKSSPANTPPPLSSYHRYNSSQTSDVLKLSSSPPVLGSPRSPTSRSSQQHQNNGNGVSASSAALASALDSSSSDSFGHSSSSFVTSSSPTKENESPFDADAKTPTLSSASSALAGSSLSRTPTLSWQQRRPPSSSGGGGPDRSSRSRPLSIVAAENAAARSSISSFSNTDKTSPLSPEPKTVDTNAGGGDAPISRDQIAQALGAKDPSWFRQTADRGAKSAAYRRTQVEDEDRQDLHAASARLPGLSRGPSAEPEYTSSRSDFSPPPPAHSSPSSAALSPSLQASIARKTSPSLPLTPSQKLDPPREARESSVISPRDSFVSPRDSSIISPRDSIVSPPSGRTSPIRPLSPTKGAGGFVQSAMMKRSDSVKRWSVTSPPGLARADSIARSAALEGPRRSATSAQTKSTSRPTSSHGGRESASNSRPSTPTRLQTTFPEDEPTSKETTAVEEEKKVTPPSSPSKTMDPRRWSPTKTSSWLDAALSKPESPKPKVAALNNHQPAWMVELNKAKQQKASNPGEATPTPPPVARKHEVKTGGLLRSGPMGTAAANATPTPAAAATPLTGRSGLGISMHTPSSSISGVSAPSTATTSKPAALPKEPTPPPKGSDLRAGLKPRQPLPSEKKDGGSGNELQSIVGGLRRTKTQNYVAPDVLMDNITRGKSALNVTGGPKPREKKDELKDAIMQKKAEFNQAKSEGRGISTNAHAKDKEAPVPEGVAKRLVLNKTGGSQTSNGSLAPYRRDSSPSKAMAEAAARSIRENNSVRDTASASETPASFSRSSTASTLSGSSTTEVPETTTRAEPEPVSSPPVKNSFGSVGRAGARIGGLGSPVGGGGSGIGAGSALASRFNPALAGLLARGPPAMSSGNSSPSEDSAASPILGGRVSSPAASSSAATEPPPGPGPQLTHMTKNRARGPRRKAPSNLQQSTPSPKAAEETPAKPLTPKKVPPPTTPKKADIVVPQVISLVDSSSNSGKKTAPEPAQKPASVRGSPVISLVDSSKANKFSSTFEDSPTPSKPANVISLVDSSSRKSPISNTYGTPSKINIHEQVASVARNGSSQPFKPAVAKKPSFEKKAVEEPAPAPVSQPSSPKKIDNKRMSRFLEQSANQPPVVSQPVEVPRPLSPSKTGGARPLPTPRPLSPQKTGGSARPLPVAPVSPKKNEWQPTSPVNAGLASPPPASSGTFRRSKVFGGDTPVLAAASPQQPPRTPSSSMRLEPQGSAPASPALSSPMRSPTKQAQEVTVVLNEFFGPDRPSRNYRMDTADILANRPQTDVKIKTLSAQLYRVSSDGKKQPVPAHYERVLFEREMYLCPHTFTNTSSGWKTTEVYFWAGDDVPEAMVQDAQVFLSREARAVGGTLVQLQQGKETAEFLLALGGIVTIRRGSSNTYDSLAPSMFCGRQYLGQIAFDEVDFEPASLCSGFPYLITKQGKCYLWKGKGSNVDELSCARLIGMDLALMGELAEIEDGKESANFWALFQGSRAGMPGSADHWRLKPKYDRYARRLFQSTEGAGAKQVSQTAPS